MSESFKGVLAIVLACVVWGLSPLYYRALSDVPALEVLAHRALWSFALFVLILFIQGRLKSLIGLVANPRAFAQVAFASVMISVNWFYFIWATQTGQNVQTSLGYFMHPLVSVALGYFVFRERLHRLQVAAVFLFALAILVLVVVAGAFPWVSLTLAISFGLYGLIKKNMSEGPVLTVAAEVTLFLPLSVGWLVMAHAATGPVGGNAGAFGGDFSTSLLLIVSGLITAVPLILFSYGARRIPLATLGVTNYLNPLLQFILAVFLFAEPFSVADGAAFVMIWVALILYSVSAFSGQKTRTRPI